MGPADRPLLRGLDVDAGGTAYVAATGCGSVLRITPNGSVSILFQTEAPWSPTGVALFGNDVYVLEFLGAASDNRQEMIPRIRKIAPDGSTRIIATVARSALASPQVEQSSNDLSTGIKIAVAVVAVLVVAAIEGKIVKVRLS